MEEEVLAEDSNTEDWEQHSDDNLEDDGSLDTASRSNQESGDNSSRNWDADEEMKMYDVDIAKETVADRQVLEDSASSSTAVQQEGQDSLTIAEYESEDAYQSASGNDSESDDSDEERYSMYNTVSAHQSHSRLPSQSSIPQVHQSVTGYHGPESFAGLDNDSANEFLSASEGDEELIGPHEGSLAVKGGHQTETVSIQGAVHVSAAGAEATLAHEVAQKQLATDLPHHQNEDTEDTLEQVINLPEHAQDVKDVSQGKPLSEQEDMPSSAWIEEASPSAQLPGPSPAANIQTPSSTMEGESVTSTA